MRITVNTTSGRWTQPGEKKSACRDSARIAQRWRSCGFLGRCQLRMGTLMLAASRGHTRTPACERRASRPTGRP